MPKGMTPKKRMGRSTMSLARNLKPSGRLNKDDIEKAEKLRKTTPLSEQKNMKKFSKYMKQEMNTNKVAKGATKAASMMGVAGSMKGIKELMKKISDIKTRQEKTKRPGSRPNTNSKTKTPSSRTFDRRPMGTKALGPLRPIRERSQSKLVSRRRGMGKR